MRKRGNGGSGGGASRAQATPDAWSTLRWVTGGFGTACAVVLLLQMTPLTGIVLMTMLGPWWIGVLVHLYMISIAVMALTREVPRIALAIPAAFYAIGVQAGLEADRQAADWKRSYVPLEIAEQVPASVQHVVFEPWNMLDSRRLRAAAGAFRPEDAGFTLARSADKRLVPMHESTARCGRDAVRLGERCYRIEPGAIGAHVQIGSRTGRSSGAVIEGPLNTVRPTESPILLREQGVDRRIGVLRGALIRKSAYVLFPTTGCYLNSALPRWQCQWSIVSRTRTERVGFYPSVRRASPETVSLLMSALKQLRGDRP